MKTNNKEQYKISATGLETQPDLKVRVQWENGTKVRVTLGELWDRIHNGSNLGPVLAKTGLVGSWLDDGRKVGIYPTITALTERAAQVLSLLTHVRIEVGDGFRYGWQSYAEKDYTRMCNAGLKDELRATWMIGKRVEARPVVLTQGQLPLLVSIPGPRPLVVEAGPWD